MNTQFDEVRELMKERILQIKKDSICHINNSVYDVNVDQVFTNICEWRTRKHRKALDIVILADSGKIGGHIGNKRIETYNIDIEIEYKRGSGCPDSDYELYYNHLIKWIYLLLTDHTGTINSFWRQIYNKTGFCDFEWEIVKKNPPSGFNAIIKLKNLNILTDIDTMFV
jgi:hypothetical protein